MAKDSSISWTHHTFNPWMGCTKVSEGCKNCYAERGMDHRYGKTKWGPKGLRVVTSEGYWKQPARWDREAEKAGERRRVFCASLADVFEGEETMPQNAIEDVRIARARLFDRIVETPNLDWLLLTKRPENVMPMWSAWAEPGKAFFGNVWIGTSVEDQAAADERIPHLLEIPAAVRFLSCEPLLGPVDLLEWMPQGHCRWQCSGCRSFHSEPKDRFEHIHCPFCQRVDYACGSHVGNRNPNGQPLNWVIAGGESGSNARPMHPDWARSLRDQCAAAGVPFHHKQNGEWLGKSQGGEYIPGRADLFRELAPREHVYRVGVKKAGRLLDGVLHDAFPEVALAR